MKITNLIAFRTAGTITVLVTANLPRSCDSARIVDKYPGGNIQYFVDPGEAQVFIEYNSPPEMCPTVVVPWIGQVQIHDDYHEEVRLFINHVPITLTEIIDATAHQQPSFQTFHPLATR
ncbi:hypothetical protein P4H61_08500 [Paenibacillus peoriae]|uniref:hypothetical protein n=2 Tax=Paenibacillus TaxID=44249 RepID=UPI00026C5BA2|nr:hypothetical protein [Paenibacillus peoriae]MEC0181539.1 hypothetical protein [Paenibacillus peoriae]